MGVGIVEVDGEVRQPSRLFRGRLDDYRGGGGCRCGSYSPGRDLGAGRVFLRLGGWWGRLSRFLFNGCGLIGLRFEGIGGVVDVVGDDRQSGGGSGVAGWWRLAGSPGPPVVQGVNSILCHGFTRSLLLW
ncbi:hypothetical protein AWC21_01730 [Mycolicibacterium peregrinum]|nr:hypothetical protein AWC21_01730 [Mycolicibacterium peregrinum]